MMEDDSGNQTRFQEAGATTAGSGGTALPTELRRAFGFGGDEDEWFSRLGACGRTRSLERIGSFDLIAEAGRGGQGFVYRARQTSTGREVALKRLLAGVFATPEMRARFDREVEAAAALDHPNIVTLYGRELIDGQPLLVMQWIDGTPFDVWARPADGPPRAAADVMQTFLWICEAIHYAHQRGIIHRDLKPSNILVDRDGRPHVLDFGLAKMQRNGDMTLTREGDFLGTPAYAAPEQIGVGGRGVDVRTDVYALGSMLYEALTGRRPYGEAETLAKLVETMQRAEPRPPSAVAAGIPRDLDAIVLTAIAREPERRYGSVEALAADARRYLAGEVVLAHPPSAAYRVRKFLRRHAVASSLSTVAALAVVGLGVVSTVQAARERGLRKAAEDASRTAHEQTVIATNEARRQRTTTHALLNVLLEAKGHVLNRHTVSTHTLAGWFADLVHNQELVFDPDELIQLHASLADLYRWVRDHDAALEHSRRALGLLEEHDAANGAMRCTILTYMAETLTKHGRPAEGERIAREAIAAADASIGRDTPEGTLAIEEWARALYALGRGDESQAALHTASAIHTQIGSAAHRRVAPTVRIADMLTANGQLDEARTLLERSVATLDPAEEAGSNHAAWLLTRLATVDVRQGLYADAERRLARVTDYRLRTQGVTYGRTADDLRRHAWALHMLGRYEEAVDQMETALVYYEYERKSPQDAARARFAMAVAMLAAGREDEGRRQLRKAVSLGAAAAPGDSQWDDRVAQLEAVIRGNGFRYDESLISLLGEDHWLVFNVDAPPPW